MCIRDSPTPTCPHAPRPPQVLHRVGLALLKVSEARLLQCVDQQELLCSLQEDVGNCFDWERL
eukprot:1160661-Prymnesium_polylepis.1